jgi:branched-chain amino acid transport system substrate-binding protein
MKMIRTIGIVAFLCVALSGMAFAAPDILIGNIQDLTGFTAAWGEGQTNGAQIAVDEINAKGGLLGGRKVKLVTYDFKGQVPESINAYNRITGQDKVVAVLGSSNSAVHIALAPITATAKVPIVSDAMDERATTPAEGQTNKYIFLLSEPSSGQQARILASYAINTLKYTKFATLYDQGNAFAVSLTAPFADYIVRNKGVMVASEPYVTGTKDFRTLLLKIQAASPDAIMLPNYLQDEIVITKQMAEIGLKIPIIGFNTLGVPYAQNANPDSDGALFINNADLGDPKYAKLLGDYAAKFKKDPVINVLFGYDNMMLVANAITRAKSTKPDDIVKALEQTQNFQGTLGKISADPATHRPINFPMIVQKVVDGKYVTVDKDVLAR